MRLIILLVTFFLLFSCNKSSEKDQNREVALNVTNKDKNNTSVNIALTFINSYVDNCNKMRDMVEIIEWVNTNNLTTAHFKYEVKKVVMDAFKLDPELGLGSDPIFDAQDYPEKGFELESINKQTNFIVVKGRGWSDFKLTIKVVLVDGKWLVDGCGLINIPKDKRSLR